MEPEDRSHLCFPQLPNISCGKSSSAGSEGVFFGVLLPVECVATVLLNSLVIISISHYRQLHTPTNMLLLSLAVSDFLMGLLSMPNVIYQKASCWFLGDVMCSLWNYLIFISSAASVGNMALISADRYVAICDPLRYNVKVTVKRVQLCVGLCWLGAVIHCGIVLMDQLAHPGKYNSCLGECLLGFEFYGGVLDLVMCFVLPLGIIITLYVRVFAVAASQARAVRSHARRLQFRRPDRFRAKTSEIKAAGTLGVLVLVFLACFCPYYIVNLVGDDRTAASVGKYVLYLFDFNSCVNPLIYTFFYPWFRRAAKHIVTLRILRPGSREANNIL